MQILIILNQKGGVGKSTSAQNLGAALQIKGKKCLLIDLDPQGNLSHGFGINTDELKYTIYDLLKKHAFSNAESISINDVIVKTSSNLDVIPANIDLANAEFELVSALGREFLLKDVIKETYGYDYVIIDCPPSLGILTQNALFAGDSVLVPVHPEYYSLKGLAKIVETIDKIKSRNEDLKLWGVFISMFDTRLKLHKESMETVQSYFSKEMFKTIIRKNPKVSEAQSYGKTIFEYNKSSNGAKDYMELAKEIIERGEQRGS